MKKQVIPGARYLNDTDCEFVLWAPMASSVKLILTQPDRSEYSLKKGKDGYWQIAIPNCKPGTRYLYKLDDRELNPDPASLSQPEGVNRPSEVIKFSDFVWEDPDWQGIPLSKLIIYELHTGTFTEKGSFEGIISKLDYLKELGVNAIELMPVAQFPGNRNWGYDGVFIYAAQNTYGGPHGFMHLINECHKRQLVVILDVVYNHHGPEGNYLGNFGPYMSDVHSTPWGKAFNFDGKNCNGVRDYFIQNTLMWLKDFHIDGLRMDAVHAMHDNSEKYIITEIAEAVERLNRDTGRNHFLIGEVNLNDVKFTKQPDKGGYGLHSQWNDDFHHSLHVLTTGEKNGYYADFIEKDSFLRAYKEAFILKGQYSKFRNRKFGKSAGNTKSEKFIIYSQNHDQVGNRRYGERKSVLVSFEMQKLIAISLILSPYIPMLFMGEEYGEINPFLFFIDFESEYLINLITKGRELEFKMLGYKSKAPGYNPFDAGSFQQSKLNWKKVETESKSASLFNFYRTLINLRKSNPVLQNPDRRKMTLIGKDNIFIIKRWQGREKLVMIFNFSKKPKKCKTANDLSILVKIIDSTDSDWGGKGSLCPNFLYPGDSLNISGESAVVYSTLQGTDQTNQLTVHE